ncbi:Phosphate-selective porin [Bacteroidales bacterium Barb7]|nr:Phosphate-selective porin [Bacteroidales bacterium Barb7]
MKKIFTQSLFVAVATSFLSLNIQAQENKALEDRVAKIEGITSKLPSISGLVNGRFQYSDAGDGSNSFDIRRARLDLRGNLSSKFDYRLQTELAGTPKVLDAFLRWKPSSYFNVQAGQFKYSFSLENPYSPTTLETIENSTVISKLSGYSDEAKVGGNGRDIGIAFYGGFVKKKGYNLIDYSVGIVNGNGINNTDNNKGKNFTGILTVNPIKELALAVSHYNGSTGVAKTDADGKEVKVNGKTVIEDFDRTRTGFGAKYDNKTLLVRGEYITGKTDKKESDGFYVTAAYYVTPKVQPVLKYDYYRTDTKDTRLDKDAPLTNYIAGVNYYPIKNLRLQLNYTYKTQEGAAKDENRISAQLLVTF